MTHEKEPLANIPTSGAKKFHVMRDDTTGLLLSDHFTRVRQALPTESHEVTFVIQQRNTEELKRIFHEVSDPSHANYGNYMTQKEIIDLTSNPKSHEEVVAYLQAAGAEIMPSSFFKEHVVARGTLKLWERIFDTKFHLYSIRSDMARSAAYPSAQNTTFMRAEKYSVPFDLDAHVASVKGVVDMPMPQMRKSRSVDLSHLDSSHFSTTQLEAEDYITPGRLCKRYNVIDSSGHPRATQAILMGHDQYWSPDDLTQFQTLMKIPVMPLEKSISTEGRALPKEKCRGNEKCSETNLDVQYIMGMAHTPTWLVYNSDVHFSKWLLKWVYSSTPPPLVMSVSYYYEEQYIDKGEKDEFDQAAIKLGVMGVTILFASGDDGVNNPSVRQNAGLCAYRPAFPCSSPYVTVVGGTQVRLHFIPYSIIKSALL